MLGADAHLTAQPRIAFRRVKYVEQVLLIRITRGKFVQPLLVQVHVAGATGAEAAANRRHAPFMFPERFHQAVTFARLDFMNLSIQVFYRNTDQNKVL